VTNVLLSVDVKSNLVVVVLVAEVVPVVVAVMEGVAEEVPAVVVLDV
jgi:hypothetical protein